MTAGFLSATLAEAIDLEGVAGGRELMLAANVVLNVLDLGGKKLNGDATLGTNHMMVVAAIVLVLVARDAIVERHLAGQAAFRQKLQRSVYRREPDAVILLLDQPIEFVRGKVVMSVEEGAQNGIALARLLEADPPEMIAENRLRLACHFPRDGRLIINSFLEHRCSAP